MLVGIDLVKIVRPSGRRLNSRLPGCSKQYITSLESNIIKHKLLERLHKAHRGAFTDSERQQCIIIIDEEGKAYMRHAKKICRKLKSCQIPFSPEAAIWIRRVQVYRSLLQYHKGKIRNCGNLKRAARRCNIPNPLGMSIHEIAMRLEECKRECLFFHEHGKRYRRKHLETRKKAALDADNKDAFQKISAIIQQEQQRAFWQKLNCVTGKK